MYYKEREEERTERQRERETEPVGGRKVVIGNAWEYVEIGGETFWL